MVIIKSVFFRNTANSIISLFTNLYKRAFAALRKNVFRQLPPSFEKRYHIRHILESFKDEETNGYDFIESFHVCSLLIVKVLGYFGKISFNHTLLAVGRTEIQHTKFFFL